MRRLFLPVAVGTAILVALPLARAQVAQTVAFTNVTVIPMDSNRVLADHTAIVTNGRIAALGPSRTIQVPDGAVRVEGRGKFLMPGLGEMHGHVPSLAAPQELTENILFLYVAGGVTTVRGMQGSPGQLDLRARASKGDIIAPTLYLAGPPFSGGAVKTPEEAAARVRQQKTEGWDLLKVQTGLSLESYDAMARTAKEVGIGFGGHVPAAVGVVHALDMGQETFDHIDGYAEHLDGLTKPIDERALQDLVARTKKAGAWIVPTMFVWETLRGPVTLESRTSLPELKYLPRAQIDQWTRGLENRVKNPQVNSTHAAQYMKNRVQILRALHGGGVGVLLGSDAPQQFNVPGFSIHREMKSMVDAGMSPYEVLKSGTSDVGAYFKSKDQFGTIAVGQRADLILVDANPLQNVANASRRAGVMIRGRWIPESEIRARLEQIASAHAKTSSPPAR